MALQDFIQKLQEEDNNIVWSKPSEDNSTHIITPVSPSIERTEQVKPTVIKFKLKTPTEQPQQPPPVVFPHTPKEIVLPSEKTITSKQIEREVKEAETAPQISDEELLFKKSETDISKKEIWFEYYEKACKSKKENYITKKCRAGKFMITEDDKFIILSEYDTYDKSAEDILNDSWF